MVTPNREAPKFPPPRIGEQALAALRALSTPIAAALPMNICTRGQDLHSSCDATSQRVAKRRGLRKNHHS
jgi:hypothetical protein